MGLGIDEEDFGLLTVLSSWATSASSSATSASSASAASSATASSATAAPDGTRGSQGNNNSNGAAIAVDDEHDSTNPEAEALGACVGESYGGLTRSGWGRLCKRLLDTGRLRQLEANGYAGRLQEYIEQAVTPENSLIVAWPSTGL